MNLSQYKSTFYSKGISGTRLSQHTENSLESQLGISQRLHRKRLMLVINGTKSIHEILTNAYDKLGPKNNHC